ncbi:ABC transporter permease [Mammaliicoccus lentus]|uniref:ABC transporter permease n=1 Tax=Mammaliicoccus lentus TaxID=42858 RepID=A0AAX3W2K9_MAMLE|nr:ABC transporter permease [Mammaliicoccus lentus]MBW0766487.1 ABC transporter permease [Mammaliicoccus lentus]WHI55271.1 ABC transporter permease [Mammaliicoccus lentus]WHI57793.1 ABC transporter permease [Mammaliicoccus lentus]WHI59424.1 ABC transporter permease [Mammaliicoccus lentus]WHI65641.1 ABC transporter permease [Mammaliicoccus lentus]
MSTLKLFNIYHSFLIKKWYLLVYILLLFIALLGLMIGIQHFNQKDDSFTIGIVDKDQSKETKLILNAVGDGQSLGDNLNIEDYNEQQAAKLLKSKKIDGYFLFKEGMTKAFYKNGELPIVVNTYDTQSIESIVIMQLTDSVYSRLMLSMGGALSYTHVYENTSDEELLTMMTDMLFTGLNRNGSFEEEPVKVYDTASYYIVAFYFVSIFFFFFSIFSILKMNQKNALKERLSMFHFSYEKLTIVRGLFSLIYTAIWSCFGLWLILKFLNPDFEMYNWPTLLIYIVYYLFALTAIFIFIDITARQAFNYVWKIVLIVVILIFSGATIPVVYLKGLFNNIIDMSPFTIVMNQLLELILNNYILNVHPMFYWNILIVMCLLVISLVWRYRQ